MKRSLNITILCLFSCLLLFGSVNQLQASGADSAKLKQVWKAAEEAINTTNDKMRKLEIGYEKYKTEQETLQGDAPSGVLGMIGKGFSVALNIFFNGSKGVRLIELDALIMYTWAGLTHFSKMVYTLLL